MPTTNDWSWSKTAPGFLKHGCSIQGCEFHRPPDCAGGDGVFCCALNLSDALIRAGYNLPSAPNVNPCAHGRVRNADGMARACNAQNGGKHDVQGWSNRPSWPGIVYFESGPTRHIDFWNGKKALHTEFPNAPIVWFWQMGA